MKIRKAIKTALESGGLIYRESWPEKFPKIKPVHIALPLELDVSGGRHCWNPTPDDFFADDWIWVSSAKRDDGDRNGKGSQKIEESGTMSEDAWFTDEEPYLHEIKIQLSHHDWLAIQEKGFYQKLIRYLKRLRAQ